MKIAYIVNESSVYQRMAWCSLASLRYFNPDLAVQMVVVRDGGRDNRDLDESWFDRTHLPKLTTDQFIEEVCGRLSAEVTEVLDFDYPGENGYPPVHRAEFARIAGDNVLFLDADTFVLNDISPIFDCLGDYDVVADGNTFYDTVTSLLPTPYTGMKGFNSGVVLYGHGLIREYGSNVYELCKSFRHNTHPVGMWLTEAWLKYSGYREQIPNKMPREEIGFCCWLYENNLKSGRFQKRHVQTKEYDGNTCVFHTMTQNWLENFPRFFSGQNFKPPKRMSRRLLNPKRSVQ
jgi:hypothetical protein